MINAIKYELQIILSGIKVISNFCLDYASLASYGVVHFYCRLVQPIDAIRYFIYGVVVFILDL